jgi:hypothetical protein
MLDEERGTSLEVSCENSLVDLLSDLEDFVVG